MFAVAAVAVMLLAAFHVAAANAAAAKPPPAPSPESTAPKSDSTPTSLGLFWPNKDASVNQSRSSSTEDTISKTAQSLTVWDIARAVDGGSPDGSAGQKHKVGVDVFSTASVEKSWAYTKSDLTGGTSMVDSMWTELSSTNQVSIGLNQGAWREFDVVRAFYGAFYVDAYIATNGFIVLRNFTEANKANPSLWMWGKDTNVWNVTVPQRTADWPTNAFYNAAVIAPFWGKVTWIPSDPAQGGIRAGELFTANNKGFCVVWKNVQVNGYTCTFGVKISFISWNSNDPGAGIQAGGLNEVRLLYGSMGTTTTSYGAGVQDQIGAHYTVVTPATNKAVYLSPSADSYKAAKKMTVSYGKYVSSDGGSTWGWDSYSCVAPAAKPNSGANPVWEVFVYNAALEAAWMEKIDQPGLLEYAKALLWALAMFFMWVTFPPSGALMWLSFARAVGGQLLGLNVLDELRAVSYTDSALTDKYWISNHSDTKTQDIQMYAKDEMSGSINKAHFAWDMTVAPHLDWYIDTSADSLAKMHKLVVTTEVWYGDITTNSMTGTTKQTVTNSFVIGPTGQAAQGNESPWFGRTVPDGHSVKLQAKDVTAEIPGYCVDTIGYRAETSGSSDVGYDLMGYYTVSRDLADDTHARADRTVRVEGWFKMYDALSSTYQPTGRLLNLYVMVPDTNNDGFSESNYSVRGVYKILSTTEYNTWVFKSVILYLPWDYVQPGQAIKIGIGRPHMSYGGYTGSLIAEWAGLQIICRESTTSGEWRDNYALSVSMTKYKTKDHVDPLIEPYSLEVTPLMGTSIPLQAVGETSASGSPLSRAGIWFIDGADGGARFGQEISVNMGVGRDRSVSVIFIDISKLMLYVEPSAFGGTTVSPSGAMPMTPGASQKITASTSPSSSRVFSYWIDETGAILKDDAGTTIGYNNPVDVVVTRDRYVECVWWAGGCVAEGTMVTMADGTEQAIEKLRVGDQVLGYDLTTLSFVVETVEWTSCMKAREILNINCGELRVTPWDQPVYVRDSDGEERWVLNPYEIQIGWEILDVANGGWVQVFSLVTEDQVTKVYDFQTDGPMTYLANGYLVLDKPHRK